MVVSVIISEKNKLVIKKSNKLVEHTRSVQKSTRLESLIQYVIWTVDAYIISGDSIFIDQSKSKEIKKN
jgi:hypothetical protein